VSALLEQLTSRHGLPALDADEATRFAAEETLGVLFFPGHGQNQSETGDVAVILPELLGAFPGLRGAVVGAAAEALVAPRFAVLTFPSLVFVAKGVQVGAIPKIRAWSEMLERAAKFVATAALNSSAS